MAVEIANSGKRIRFYAVDTWEGSLNEPDSRQISRECGGSIYGHFLQNMRAGGVLDFVRPIHLPSVDAAGWFDEESLDFCFLDAAHDYHHVRADILAWKPKVKTGALLAGHDIHRYEVAPAVQDVLPWSEVTTAGESWLWRKTQLVLYDAQPADTGSPFLLSHVSLSSVSVHGTVQEMFCSPVWPVGSADPAARTDSCPREAAAKDSAEDGPER